MEICALGKDIMFSCQAIINSGGGGGAAAAAAAAAC